MNVVLHEVHHVTASSPIRDDDGRRKPRAYRASWHLDVWELRREIAKGVVGEGVFVPGSKLHGVCLCVEQVAGGAQRPQQRLGCADGGHRRERLFDRR